MLMRTGAFGLFPTRNILLEQLDAADKLLIEPYLERMRVERGRKLMDANATLDMVFFPETVLVSMAEDRSGDSHMEVGLVGREGLIGWPVLLGGELSTHSAVVQMSGGTIIRIRAADLAHACLRSPTLRVLLLKFVEIVTVQMARTIVAKHQSVDHQLSRWLLMRHDRVSGDQLSVRHDEISANLGVRRASVTDGLHALEGDRLIRCSRGRITIRDRRLLQGRAGSSYGYAEAHYRRLIAPFGRVAAE